MPISIKYIAKPDTWFKAGSEAKLMEYLYTGDDGKMVGIFRGTYIVGDTDYDKFWTSQGFNVSDEVQMNEACSYDEFYVETDNIVT